MLLEKLVPARDAEEEGCSSGVQPGGGARLRVKSVDCHGDQLRKCSNSGGWPGSL